MPSALLVSCLDKIEALKKNLLFNQEVQEFLAAQAQNTIVSTLVPLKPHTSEWKVIEHCATFSRLYCIYESFVFDVITDWLLKMPGIFTYSELDTKFKNHHRTGIAHVLSNLTHQRYQRLNELDVVKDFFYSINNSKEYSLLPEAFCYHDNNLRFGPLMQVLSKVSIDNASEWLNNYPAIIKYFQGKGTKTDVEHDLDAFVQDRNDASHGSVTTVYGTGQLLDSIYFIENLCQGIFELFQKTWIMSCKAKALTKNVGKITEYYSRNVVVAVLSHCSIFVGMNIYVVDTHRCYKAKIEELRIDDKNVPQVAIDSAVEVGLRLDTKAKKGMLFLVPH